ncbi:hypothetical protein QJS10_CPA09g00197 [Acorus calamus]|uniref:Uncharacterized protein n=1 Tax=Acorus calamus TaxID=4465 RepID=A0AAV9E7C1_ACOCL|nr:hypothetical protein QJS10_CPA09g00197 [Acorus calamus]
MDRLIGWCGPLIDLSSAASHVGDYVQLLVLVRQSRLVQVLFSDKLIAHARFGSSTREKLKKVMEWVQQTESVRHGVQPILNDELYVWDESAQIPLLVKNKSAEALFGNITADNVYKSFLQRNNGQALDSTNDHKADGSHLKYAGISRAPHVRLLDEDGNHQQQDSLLADDVNNSRPCQGLDGKPTNGSPAAPTGVTGPTDSLLQAPKSMAEETHPLQQNHVQRTVGVPERPPNNWDSHARGFDMATQSPVESFLPSHR